MLSILKEIQKEGGIPFDLKLKNGKTMKVNLILYVQFVIQKKMLKLVKHRMFIPG